VSEQRISAIVLAAGLSTRMGGPMKVLLPWADQPTILEHIVSGLRQAGLSDILVVTGHRADEVGQAAARAGVRAIHNPEYRTGEMLSSLKVGLAAQSGTATAAFMVLGDQPRLNPAVIAQVMSRYALGDALIVAPSYHRRRGHPILIDRRVWPELLALPGDASPRDVINRYVEATAYVLTDDDGVLSDIDTPQAYRDEQRRAGLDEA
jgi:molybdenum cofactor cytidylyltransferase